MLSTSAGLIWKQKGMLLPFFQVPHRLLFMFNLYSEKRDPKHSAVFHYKRNIQRFSFFRHLKIPLRADPDLRSHHSGLKAQNNRKYKFYRKYISTVRPLVNEIQINCCENGSQIQPFFHSLLPFPAFGCVIMARISSITWEDSILAALALALKNSL